VPEALGADETPLMPEVADGVPVRWLDPAAPWAMQVGALATSTRYQAAAVARVQLRYDEEQADLVHNEEWEAVLCPLGAHPDPAAAVAVDYDDRDLRPAAPPSATYVLTDAAFKSKTFWSGLQRDLVDWLVRNRTVDVFVNRTLKLWSRVGEDEAAFVGRCQEAADDLADAQAAKLRDKYRTKVQAIETKMAAANEKAAVAAAQLEEQQDQEVTGAIGDLLGSFLGGRRRTRSMASRRGTAATEARRDTANQRLAGLQADQAELEAELQTELDAIDAAWSAKAADVQVAQVRLEKTDVAVQQVALLWVPVG
jgi:hypothetical protein